MEIFSYVVLASGSGQPFDAFDQESQADQYVTAVNKAAGRPVVFAVAVPRNPAWSPSRAPGKVASTARRAAGALAA